jgi:hypothetical protein
MSGYRHPLAEGNPRLRIISGPSGRRTAIGGILRR